MTTIAVNYDFSQFKVKVTPGMVLNDVLAQSLQHFKLLQKQENESGKWGLTYNNKALELDLPWRLMNLPSGVKLQLELLNDNDNDKVIKVRVQSPGYSSKMGSVNVNATFRNFLQELSQGTNWPLGDAGAKLQFFNKTIPLSDLNEQTLKSLGIMESLSVRLILPNQNNSISIGSTESVERPVTEIQENQDNEPKKQQESRKNYEFHKVFAYIPSEKTIASQIATQQQPENSELTVEHARRYQQMVQRQTGGLGGPMIPRWLKEQQEAVAARKRVVQECLVRVRFPDRTYTEIAFRKDDTIATVYHVIASSLLDEKLPFTLYQSHPHVALASSEQKLVEDLQFGSKTLLLFESKEKGPFLKNTILENAKNLEDADDVKLDRSDKPETSMDERGKEGSSESNQPEPRKSTPGKYPKWLKLSKK